MLLYISYAPYDPLKLNFDELAINETEISVRYFKLISIHKISLLKL